MPQNHSTDALAGLVSLLNSVSDAERAALIGMATSVVAQAVALRGMVRGPVGGDEDEDDDAGQSVEYVGHALDELVIATIRMDGAQTRAQIVGALEGETYRSQAKTRKATAGTIENRVKHLAAAGVILSTRSGYVISDEHAAEQIEKTEYAP